MVGGEQHNGVVAQPLRVYLVKHCSDAFVGGAQTRKVICKIVARCFVVHDRRGSGDEILLYVGSLRIIQMCAGHTEGKEKRLVAASVRAQEVKRMLKRACIAHAGVALKG